MAAIRSRTRADGGTAHTVTWRLGGARGGAQQSETFVTAQAAAEFRRDVEAAGHRWPPGWVRGHGYLRPAPAVVAVPPPARHRLAEFGQEFVRTRTAIGPDTRTLYTAHLGRLDRWFAPIVGGPPHVEDLTRDHVRLLVNARERTGAAPKTIRNYHGLLFSVMEYAIERELRKDNPCRGTRLPDPEPVDADTDEEIMVFLTQAAVAAVVVALALGLPAQTSRAGTPASSPARVTSARRPAATLRRVMVRVR